MLHEIVVELQELMALNDSDDKDSTATVFFQDSSINIIYCSSSEADMRDVGQPTYIAMETRIFR